jgi:putative membrane protein
MLDVRLYNLMNWTMAVDGIFFWCLILDPRPKPPARIGIGLRALLVLAVEPFQMILGAILSLSMIDYYPVYRSAAASGISRRSAISIMAG